MRKHFLPNFKLYYASIKNLFSYSGKLLMSGILNKIFEIFYPLFIGKQYSAQDLGFYNRGVSIKDLIVNNIVQVVAKVSLPVFSDLTHDITQLKNVYKKVMQATFFVITPIMFGGIVVSYNLIYTVYSAKWVFASPFFQLACVLGFLYPFHYINLDILKVFSKSALFFKLEVIKISLTIIAIIISYRYGIKGIMVGQISVSIIALFLNAFYSGELLKYGIIEQFRDLLAPIMISIAMGVAIYFIGKLNYAIPMLLLIQLGCGMLVYFLLAFVFRIPIFFQLKSTLIHKLKVTR
jgi:O-antigen/teichoic acid export membrane protein